MEEWATVIIGYGCSSNSCATNKLTEGLGLMSPSLRCVVNATDGSNKIITNSKIKNVQLISDFLVCMRTILQHYWLSEKIAHLLSEVLEIIELKPIHMMTFALLECRTFSLPLPKLLKYLFLYAIFEVVLT